MCWRTWEIAPQSLDYALVDGSYRDECVMRALEVLRPGGMLILDNANWYIPHPTVFPRVRLVSGVVCGGNCCLALRTGA